jgi:L-malate glycosyltransferase
MKKQLHVLFIVKHFNNSYNMGSGVFFKEQALAVAQTGVKTGLIAVNFVSWKHILKTWKFNFGLKFFKYDKIQAVVYQTPVLPFFRILNHARRDRILKKLSKKYIQRYGQPHLCHVHSFYCGNEAIRLKQQNNIPYIITEHYSDFARNLLNSKELEIAGSVFHHSSKRIAVSEEFLSLLEKKFDMPFSYLPNIVDVKKFAPFEKGNNTCNILSVGSLDTNKNHSLLIKAFAKFNNKKSILTLVGDGPLMNKLKELVKHLQVEDRVVFAGYVAHEKLPTYYQKADLLVVPSKYETFGIVVIEALSCGIPVVSTPVGIAPSILKDTKMGYLCKNDESDMCEKIHIALNTNFDKQYMHNKICAMFSWEHIANELVKTYHEIASQYER